MCVGDIKVYIFSTTGLWSEVCFCFQSKRINRLSDYCSYGIICLLQWHGTVKNTAQMSMQGYVMHWHCFVTRFKMKTLSLTID